jgi:DNA-binding beta-propeller fold protein YncE
MAVALLAGAAAADATVVYWANAGANSLSYENLSTGTGGTVATGSATISAPLGVAIDPATGRIYWANRQAGTISWANLDGSGGGDLPTAGAVVDQPDSMRDRSRCQQDLLGQRSGHRRRAAWESRVRQP